MITSTKNYTTINIKIRNKSVADSKPKVHHLNFGVIRYLFSYSTDTGYIKLIVGI